MNYPEDYERRKDVIDQFIMIIYLRENICTRASWSQVFSQVKYETIHFIGNEMLEIK